MNKSILIFVFVAMLAIVPAMATPVACNDNTGSIWTTTSDCSAVQNVNHYVSGEKVYMHGTNFCALTYAWDITGQPGGSSGDPNIVVASGNYGVGSNGTFCFEAYTIQNDDWGEYKATFDSKHDNYRVDTSVPEFGVMLGGVALVGAFGAFLIIRKK